MDAIKDKRQMITDKIKALFQFIEFLHSNIENFKKYDPEIGELNLLQKERTKVRPRKNFADKLKYDEVQAKIKQKINVINENIIWPIKTKGIELNVCDLDKPETLRIWNISEINNLKENFSKEDIPEILLHKSKYIEFRTETNCTYFHDYFFNDLNEILKELFDFFKESTVNEFESFETKTIPVNNIREVAEQYQKGNNKFFLPIDFLNPSKVQQINSEPLPPQQTENITEQSKKINSKYTVKSIIIAYYYMFKKGIYPILEIEIKGKMTTFYKILAEKYQLSYHSFRTDWKPLEKETNRLSQPENIRLAIELLKTFDYPKIKEVIQLANTELKEAELKSK